MLKAIIYTDGGANPNPGPASIGAVIKGEDGVVLTTISESIGVATNNQAEYQAVVAALKMAKRLGATVVELRSDSELLVRQVNGEYRVKSAHVRPLYMSVKRLQEEFVFCMFTHIPREFNEAHKLT